MFGLNFKVAIPKLQIQLEVINFLKEISWVALQQRLKIELKVPWRIAFHNIWHQFNQFR